MFDSISTLAVASNMRELYRLVLVDTPLAPYFAESLTSGLITSAPLRAHVCSVMHKLASSVIFQLAAKSSAWAMPSPCDVSQ